MWLGEQITIDGIGNGISIILFAGIVSRFPTIIRQLFGYLDTERKVYYVLVPVVCVCFLLMMAYIVLLDNAERRLPLGAGYRRRSADPGRSEKSACTVCQESSRQKDVRRTKYSYAD